MHKLKSNGKMLPVPRSSVVGVDDYVPDVRDTVPVSDATGDNALPYINIPKPQHDSMDSIIRVGNALPYLDPSRPESTIIDKPPDDISYPKLEDYVFLDTHNNRRLSVVPAPGDTLVQRELLIPYFPRTVSDATSGYETGTECSHSLHTELHRVNLPFTGSVTLYKSTMVSCPDDKTVERGELIDRSVSFPHVLIPTKDSLAFGLVKHQRDEDTVISTSKVVFADLTLENIILYMPENYMDMDVEEIDLSKFLISLDRYEEVRITDKIFVTNFLFLYLMRECVRDLWIINSQLKLPTDFISNFIREYARIGMSKINKYSRKKNQMDYIDHIANFLIGNYRNNIFATKMFS